MLNLQQKVNLDLLHFRDGANSGDVMIVSALAYLTDLP